MKFRKCEFQIINSLLWVCIIIILSSCTAPKDYYLHLLAMEELGEQERGQTGRKIGEIVIPEESLQPMVIALQSEQKATTEGEASAVTSDLLKIIHTGTYKPEVIVEKSEPNTRTPGSKPIPESVPIDINKEILENFLNNENINVIGIMTKDGRLDGQKNIIQVYFSPEALSDDALYEKFLFICAIIYGLDKGKNTIDKVVGFATIEASPYMVLESKMEDYIAFADNKISYKEWVSKLVIKRF